MIGRRRTIARRIIRAAMWAMDGGGSKRNPCVPAMGRLRGAFLGLERLRVGNQVQITKWHNSGVRIVPRDAVLAELKRKAEECEEKAKQEPEPIASQQKGTASGLRA
jgi:hypothetical protein